MVQKKYDRQVTRTVTHTACNRGCLTDRARSPRQLGNSLKCIPSKVNMCNLWSRIRHEAASNDFGPVEEFECH